MFVTLAYSDSTVGSFGGHKLGVSSKELTWMETLSLAIKIGFYWIGKSILPIGNFKIIMNYVFMWNLCFLHDLLRTELEVSWNEVNIS